MFCRGDVMSRFVILEALERSGTGASKGFPFDSFPDPAQIPGHSKTMPPCQTKLPAPLLLGPGIVRLGRLNCSNYLSTCLSDHEKIPPKKRNSIGKRQEASKRVAERRDSTMSPLSDDSDPDPLSLFPLQIPRKH